MFKSSEINPAKKRAREAAAAFDKRLNQMKKVSSSSRKKQTPPSPSFVDDDSDSDSDEEEEDYQLIIKHDWAAITYLDVRSFQVWLPSTTEVRNRPV